MLAITFSVFTCGLKKIAKLKRVSVAMRTTWPLTTCATPDHGRFKVVAVCMTQV
jgi:hypothetical protein